MTMRQRSTWSKPGETSRQAATSRTADIYTMNQEHPQPSAVEYENGDPDAWAETPVSGDKMSVNAEYDGDHVKRNELNYGEFRDDTFKHKDSDKWHGPGKYDNAKVSAERKAVAAETLARALLRTANEALVEETVFDLMSLPAPALAATIERMKSTMPEALPEAQRYKRSLACAKLAARTLGEAANEKNVTALGQIFAGLDDPTLKAILRTVASAKVAQQEEQEQEGQEGHAAQQEQQAQQQEEEQEEGHAAQQEEQAHGLCPEDAALLEQLMPAPAPAAPVVAPPAAPDDLQALFQMPEAVAPAVPMMASQAAEMPDISFDDDEAMSEPAAASSVTASGLDDLFSDDPEVQAQREIMAAQQEQHARESGYSAARTASSKGAKKLGAVRSRGPSTPEQELELLWDRPQ